MENYIKKIDASLESVCNWWLETYPDDVFVTEPREIVEIREWMKKILEKIERKESVE